MIPQRELAPWRAKAPWASDLMVEQDYLISQAVGAMFRDSKLRRQLALRGGTVLHKGHLAPASRYSEDIDLVLTAKRSRRGIAEDIAAVLAPLFGAPSESVLTTVTLAVRNFWSKSEVVRLTYVYGPSSEEGAIGRLKIEVNVSEHKSLFPLTSVDLEVPAAGGLTERVPVVSYDLDEMLGTKLRALLQREHGRDLFDIWWAWRQSQRPGAATRVDPARVAAAFRFYIAQEGSSFRAREVEAELKRRMKSRKFLADMTGYLPSGVSYDPHNACADFLRVFLPHLAE